MDVGAGTIGVVKTNTIGLCEYTIDNMTKYWPGCSYLTLERNYTVHKDKLLIDIGYKYNTWKVLSFITAEDVGTINPGITY